jgi:ribosomal-protein-alanine N-acetyltransferase
LPNKISNKSPLFLQVWGNQKLNMLETERLLIKPLNYDQLIKYMAANNSLEEELGLRNSSRTISPELKEALEETFLPNVADKTKNYLYSTLWTLVSKTDNMHGR